MKFFSNEAKENESEYDREHSDVVTSDPVAVPQQRAGSPWSDAPGSPASEAPSDAPSDAPEVGSPEDELADQEERDGTDEPPARRDEVDEFGTTTYGPDGTVTPVSPSADSDSTDSPSADSDSDPALSDSASSDAPVDLSLDEPADASHEPVAVVEDEDDTAKDRAEADAEAEETIEEARADEAQAEINGAPVAVDTEPVPALATESAESTDDTTSATSDAEVVPVVAAVPVKAAATPGSVPAPAFDRLFADGDSFAERFRDIQLRFVDSPKEATADAATLVGEAVDQVTAALNSQKEALGGDSDDTEELRVQLRGYRDLLNRLSAL